MTDHKPLEYPAHAVAVDAGEHSPAREGTVRIVRETGKPIAQRGECWGAVRSPTDCAVMEGRRTAFPATGTPEIGPHRGLREF